MEICNESKDTLHDSNTPKRTIFCANTNQIIYQLQLHAKIIVYQNYHDDKYNELKYLENRRRVSKLKYLDIKAAQCSRFRESYQIVFCKFGLSRNVSLNDS